MTDQQDKQSLELTEAPEVQERRAFLRGLGKWSQAVIGGVLLGAGLTVSHQTLAGSWINRRGGGWDGGGSWINRHGGGGWINRGGGWINRGGGWINRGGGGWINSGGGWINRRGGGWGGGSWINR
ncbi:MAG: hypothetical protein NHG36_08980 [Chromatiaceae bacterium]|nr:hypothetical protein [Candidatus Thioaporhodococcus sediminis]